MRVFPKVLLASALILFLASAMALLALMLSRPDRTGTAAASVASADPLTPDEFVRGLEIPPFALVDQDGNAVTNAVFDGKLTVVDFIFTHCPLVCPIMTGTMASLVDRVKDTDTRFLSISVDPERDTPEQLKAFGARFGADFSRWRFARGDKQSTWSMVREGLMFAIEDDESLPITLGDGSTMMNIRHPSHFILVGPKGEVLGLYSATDEAAVRALEARIRGAQPMMTR